MRMLRSRKRCQILVTKTAPNSGHENVSKIWPRKWRSILVMKMGPILHAEICTLAANLIQFWTQKFDHWRRKKVARARGSDTIVVSIGRRHVRDIAHPPPAVATLLTDLQLVVGCSNVSAGLWSTLQHRWKRRQHLLRLQGLCSQGGARLTQTPHAHTRGAIANLWRPLTAHTQ